MGALFLNCFSVSPPSKLANKCHSMKHNNNNNCNLVHCQGGTGKAIKTASVVRQRSKTADRGATLMDTGNLIVSPTPNGNTQADIAVKDLVPYGGSTSLVDLQEGIGIVKFLRGKEFFITGSTGFLAKGLFSFVSDSSSESNTSMCPRLIRVLVEKILRTVPDVGKIFVLVKAKSKEAAMERLKTEIINAELFKCLQQAYGDSYQSFMLSKLVPIVGNVCESDLGLDADVAESIANEVDIIVNSAANTTFDERYDVSMDINTKGACHLMAYVNGQRQGRVMEKAFDIGDCIARENLISETTPRSIPELDIEEEFVLARDTKEGCHAGEVDQKMKELGLERMMDPIVLCYGKGQLTGFLVDPNGVLDVVPVDMVVNATLAAIARHGMSSKPDINIYHVASSVVNPLVFQDLARMLHEHYNSWPFHDSKGTPIHVTSMKLFSSMEDFSAHLWRDAMHRTGLGALASWSGSCRRSSKPYAGSQWSRQSTWPTYMNRTRSTVEGLTTATPRDYWKQCQKKRR
ncbi:fatty acyl-CoA reductase 2-like isoform X2 [Hibiscus syriacus]|uniref:Fatty acyl-CoA reductase n=1 Tax=Hibiscus syriacus TaxID=106335 RepID=A0A6A3ACL2_HIBSY|nr:fatty acyl-CoA reductase 2-like isoform X2 [Hibiscus syriacus]